MATTDSELEQQLREAGNKLAELPSSVDELLPLLDVSPNFFDFDTSSFSFCTFAIRVFSIFFISCIFVLSLVS